MHGSNNLPSKPDRQTTFVAPSSWQTWRKPPGASFIHIVCLGGGGGGAAGTAGVSGSARNGGGGGGSAGFASALWPAIFLPNQLYVYVGAGGVGGTVSGGGGVSGALSYVTMLPDSSVTQNVVIASGTAGALGGTSAAGGTAGTPWNYNAGGYPIATLNVAIVSLPGTNGVAPTTGAGSNSTISNWVNSGAAGAGTSSGVPTNGGSVTASSWFAGIAGGTVGGTTQDGSSGDARLPGVIGAIRQWPIFAGGAGGASANAAVGGIGGLGGYGCGGGGGGAGTTAGVGGSGGSGLVIIMAW
jgi:hypothetical protein